MNNVEQSGVRQPGAKTAFPAIIHIPESEENIWKGVAEVTSISRTGGSFCSSRPCVVGRLVAIVMETPMDFRGFDHEEEEFYSVVGLVQYCNVATVDGNTVYHLGIGFIGKRAPDSFRKNPLQSYCITGTRGDGMWTIKEVAQEFHNRKHPRFAARIPVRVTVVNAVAKTVVREDTITVNISAGGVSVFSRLDSQVGDKVKLAFEKLDFYCIAVVRGRQERAASKTLHLQILDAQFPVGGECSRGALV
jgi:hypothetical protein